MLRREFLTDSLTAAVGVAAWDPRTRRPHRKLAAVPAAPLDIIVLGDSWAARSVQPIMDHCMERGYGVWVEDALADPAVTSLSSWLLFNNSRIEKVLAGYDPNHSIVWLSQGLNEALHGCTADHIHKYSEYLYTLLQGFRTYHIGYEHLPLYEADLKMEAFYRGVPRETKRDVTYIEMRGVVHGTDYAFVDHSHMTAASHRMRVDYIFDKHLKYHVSL